MKKIIILLTLVAFISSCSNSQKPKKPKNLISKEKMVDILIDVSIVNSAKGINKLTLEKNGVVPEQYIYKKYQIDSVQFILSNEYYTYHLKDYQDIIVKVNDSLSALKSVLNVALEKEKLEERKKDSLKRSSLPKKEIRGEGQLNSKASDKN